VGFPDVDYRCEGIIQATGKLDRCRYQEDTILLLVFTAYAQILSLCIANWMLLLRVSALYGHNRIIFWSLTTFWILSYIVTLTMMGITAGDLHGEWWTIRPLTRLSHIVVRRGQVLPAIRHMYHPSDTINATYVRSVARIGTATDISSLFLYSCGLGGPHSI